ncbi:TatD family hydrolase [Ureaplasma miroungigenitalium]|uniref:TatD family hydrolase n=1 Tax=Ureaplasma miroungigenitalium TaxID=1042321 RepID=A0ABT3BMK1_9BACT|nr:TatD family hydrolase [Ureaplasma miroungigenitalium]MCV3728454.1 TatD family hydrolase [Ureaplasma miroungigenitalium]MCV3734241.1 TatD family hydrolase [Ureaplasma miroungigenitalium]
MKKWDMIDLIDTHTHTNMTPLQEEFDEIAQHALENKIGFNIVSCDRIMCELAVKQAAKYAHIVASIGIHPTELADMTDADLLFLEKLIIEHRDQIVCIGEIGLDYYHELPYDKSVQKYWFKKQLELALKYDLPVNLHIRNAHDDAIEILQEYQIKKAIIHCFTDAYKYVLIYNSLDYYVSFPGVITFKPTNNNNISELHQCIQAVNINRLLVETDAPFLTPAPLRGKTNYPYYVVHTANKMAEILGYEMRDLYSILKANALRIFGFKK